MIKKNLLSLFFLVVFLGCANTYKLEKKSSLSFKESYYTYFSSPIKGGDSGYNIYFILNDSINLTTDKIQLNGVYFDTKFGKLKNQGNNVYQAFIVQKGKGITFDKDVSVEVKKKDEIPFTLELGEAVVSYMEGGNQKYFKVKLKKRELKNIPM